MSYEVKWDIAETVFSGRGVRRFEDEKEAMLWAMQKAGSLASGCLDAQVTVFDTSTGALTGIAVDKWEEHKAGAE